MSDGENGGGEGEGGAFANAEHVAQGSSWIGSALDFVNPVTRSIQAYNATAPFLGGFNAGSVINAAKNGFSVSGIEAGGEALGPLGKAMPFVSTGLGLASAGANAFQLGGDI